jgi:hypothetical protein
VFEINSPINLHPVIARTNQIKANWYSKRKDPLKPGTVRDWLTEQSFEAQLEYGMRITRMIEDGIIQ